MYCLSCGDCCRRMSPLSAPDPCPHLEQIGDIYLCAIYERRPEVCANHRFPAHICPIGTDVLKITDIEQVRRRVDAAWELICEKKREAKP